MCEGGWLVIHEHTNSNLPQFLFVCFFFVPMKPFRVEETLEIKSITSL